MAQAREVVPVMAEHIAPKAKSGGAATKGSAARKGLGGTYGASFTGEGTRGLTFERRWTRPGVHPYDEITWMNQTGISMPGIASCFTRISIQPEAVDDVLARQVHEHRPVDRQIQLVDRRDVVLRVRIGAIEAERIVGGHQLDVGPAELAVAARDSGCSRRTARRPRGRRPLRSPTETP